MMLHINVHPDHGRPLAPAESAGLDAEAAADVLGFLACRPDHHPTPLHTLPALAEEYGIGSLALKDESARLGLGSFKALGGAYAVVRLVLEEASRALGRHVRYEEMQAPAVRAIAEKITITCATDGNHGRSVAQGAELVGANCTIFTHTGVSQNRVDAIARFGAEVVRVPGVYDDAVAEALRLSQERGWLLISDTSWPGYERTPALVMQGYTAMMHEAVESLHHRPTHIFVQAGVGGLAAAVAGYLSLAFGVDRPTAIVVEPDRAACLYETARAGRLVKVAHGEPTLMAMLECYQPSLLAWRILSRTADAFMTVGEEDAVAAMNLLARPRGNDPAIVAGESGGVGLAGLAKVAADATTREKIGLGPDARVLVINTEGATDPALYHSLTGLDSTSVGQKE